ncbi:uncharacterized protein LOC143025257 isoform X2 [Oratosquilla oratoria]|uniref:uncharacterized protein LOC143025257 isoform X2 n=1 Tax=Oratosquilla oratoria TaxID=337810 RepID=UPI003F75B538
MALNQILLAACMAVALTKSLADKLPAPTGYGYSAPVNPIVYAPPPPPPPPTYHAPAPAYHAPAPPPPPPVYHAPVTTAAPVYHAPAPTYEKGMPFDFAYAVKDDYTGNDFAHASNSDGNVVKGEYRVLLPDGRTQIVTYTADHHNGYVAEVKYEGEAKYPEYKPAPAYHAPTPVYHAPAPAYGAPAK